MKIINPRYSILTDISEGGRKECQLIERIGRICYHSEDKITDDSYKGFITRLITMGHESVLEHSLLTVLFTVDRGLSHEIVRHRHCAFTQESTRYCDYSNTEKYPDGVIFIIPSGLDESNTALLEWWKACEESEFWYKEMIKNGAKPEIARSVLPNATKTSLVVSTNYREWRLILKLRTGEGAHPDMRSLMTNLGSDLANRIPIIFGDFTT